MVGKRTRRTVASEQDQTRIPRLKIQRLLPGTWPPIPNIKVFTSYLSSMESRKACFHYIDGSARSAGGNDGSCHYTYLSDRGKGDNHKNAVVKLASSRRVIPTRFSIASS